MALKQGDAVTNAKCPDWGTGVVLSIGPTSVEVEFPEIGRKRLLTEVIAPSSDPAPVFPKKSKKAAASAAGAKKAR
jgi:hypothetical protein